MCVESGLQSCSAGYYRGSVGGSGGPAAEDLFAVPINIFGCGLQSARAGTPNPLAGEVDERSGRLAQTERPAVKGLVM